MVCIISLIIFFVADFLSRKYDETSRVLNFICCISAIVFLVSFIDTLCAVAATA